MDDGTDGNELDNHNLLESGDGKLALSLPDDGPRTTETLIHEVPAKLNAIFSPGGEGGRAFRFPSLREKEAQPFLPPEGLTWHGLKDAVESVQGGKVGLVGEEPAAAAAASLKASDSGLVMGLCLLVSLGVGLVALTWFFFLLGVGGVAGAAVGLGVAVGLGLGSALSPRFRAALLASGPSFGTPPGQLAVALLATSLLLAGPAANIAENAGRLGVSMACVAETGSLGDILRLPYAAVEAQLLKAASQWDAISAKVKDKASAVESAVRQVTAVADKAEASVASVGTKCRDKLDGLGDTCRASAGRVAAKCEEKLAEAKGLVKRLVPDPSSIASSLKDRFGDLLGRRRRKRSILDDVCDSLDVSSVCQGVFQTSVCSSLSLGPLGSQLGRAKAEAEGAVEWVHGLLDLNLTAAQGVKGAEERLGTEAAGILAQGPKPGLISATRAIHQATTYLHTNIRIINIALLVVKVLVPLAAVTVLWLAWRYVGSWLVSDSFDNSVVVQKDLLPLTPLEEDKFGPKGSRSVGVGLLVGSLVLAALAFGADAALAFALGFAAQHGDVSVELGSAGSLGVAVAGSGPLAQFLKVFVEGLSAGPALNVSLGLKPCLPQPSHLDGRFVAACAVLYAGLVALVVWQGRWEAVRRDLLGWLYPRRKAQRRAWLADKVERGRSAGREKLVRRAHAVRLREERAAALRPSAKRLCCLCGLALSAPPDGQALGPDSPLGFRCAGCRHLFCRPCRFTQQAASPRRLAPDDVCVLCLPDEEHLVEPYDVDESSK